MKRALLFVAFVAACDGTGEFDGGVGVDAGPIGNDTVPLSAIGKVCTYDPSDPNAENPANQCDPGVDCLMFSSDGVYTSGLALPGWEDQFTIYQEDPRLDVGYCTPISNLADTSFACPAGSAPKVLSPNILVCLKLCNAPGDCGRSDYTCDVRFFDVIDQNQNELPTCVRQCKFDIPDCVRSGIVQNPNDPQSFLPELLFDDLSGGSECGDDGVCISGFQRGVANPGEPCTRTEQCKQGAACMQAPVLGAVLGAQTSSGFCASPCTPAPPGSDPTPAAQQGTCSDNFVCQSAGLLNLGFVDPANGVPGPIVRDFASGAITTVGGFCFHQCVAGVQGQCGEVLGTTCGSLDEARVGDTWNQVPQCLPDVLAN